MSELVIRSSRPTPFAEHLSPVLLVRALLGHGELIRGFAARDVLERNKGAVLGVAWNIVHPLLTLVIYTAVFGYMFGTKWERGSLPPRLDFPLVFFVGHALFHLFAESANRATTAVSGRPNLVRKVVFPLEILPVAVVVSALVYAAIAVGICVAVLLIAKGSVPWTVVLFPVVLVPLVMLAMGVAWFLAAVGVFLHDMRHIVQVLTQLAMFSTPIFYKTDRLPADAAWIGHIIDANPLSVIIENGRRALLWGEPLQWARLGVVTLLAAGVMQTGYAVFMGLRRGMADVH